MTCTEAYKEHIEYTFNAFCRVVIRYAAINAWRDRNRTDCDKMKFLLNISQKLERKTNKRRCPYGKNTTVDT